MCRTLFLSGTGTDLCRVVSPVKVDKKGAKTRKWMPDETMWLEETVRAAQGLSRLGEGPEHHGREDRNDSNPPSPAYLGTTEPEMIPPIDIPGITTIVHPQDRLEDEIANDKDENQNF